MDDFSLTVTSDSHRTNIHRLQDLFHTLTTRADRLEVKFSTLKTELIHWRTTSQRSPLCQAPIALDGLIFCPVEVVRWFSYWLSRHLTPSTTSPTGASWLWPASLWLKGYPPPVQGSGPSSTTASRKASSSLFSPTGRTF